MIIWTITTPEDFWTGFLLAIAVILWAYVIVKGIRIHIREQARRMFEQWKEQEGKE